MEQANIRPRSQACASSWITKFKRGIITAPKATPCSARHRNPSCIISCFIFPPTLVTNLMPFIGGGDVTFRSLNVEAASLELEILREGREDTVILPTEVTSSININNWEENETTFIIDHKPLERRGLFKHEIYVYGLQSVADIKILYIHQQ